MSKKNKSKPSDMPARLALLAILRAAQALCEDYYSYKKYHEARTDLGKVCRYSDASAEQFNMIGAIKHIIWFDLLGKQGDNPMLRHAVNRQTDEIIRIMELANAQYIGPNSEPDWSVAHQWFRGVSDYIEAGKSLKGRYMEKHTDPFGDNGYSYGGYYGGTVRIKLKQAPPKPAYRELLKTRY